MTTTISQLPAVIPHHRISPLNPNQYAAQPLKSAASYPGAGAATTTTRTHLSNLDQLLQKQSPQPPLQNREPDPQIPLRGGGGGGGGYSGLFNALNLPVKFPSARSAAEELMSPRSLTHLQRLLSDPRPSPRNTIAPRWRSFHGANNWRGLLDPLDENLRRELVRYGDLVQSAYHAFHSSPAVRPDRHHSVVLPDRSYRVTRSLYATSSIDLPRWVNAGVPDWMTQRSSWIGYVAVCDNDREIHRMGRRDIVIALRGTATCLEWAENFRANLVPIDGEEDQGTETSAAAAEKVECGFRSLYKTPGAEVPSLSSAVVDEVRRLVERYKGEELSITVTGHSLGAALSVLVAEELSRAVPEPPPIAVFSFGGPRVGNRGFADRVERSGVKVLRVVNAHDVVTRVPGVLPPAPPRKERGGAAEGKKGGWSPAKMLEGIDGYADVGTELRVDSRVSPYLRPDADPACCHDLEAYLHLVDGFLGTHCPFRSNAKRGLSRLMSQQGSNVKKLYMTKAKSLVVDPNSCRLDGGRSSYGNYLTSPS